MDKLTLLIDTPDGLLHREVAAAAPLPEGVERGVAAEEAIRFAAALWGMPDFIFEPTHEASGSGVREVGDGILITSGVAVMIQSKARSGVGSTPEKERNWLDKNIAKGLRQAAGSIRRLRSRPVQMTNRRGRDVIIDGAALSWVSVVLVDHDSVPEGYVPPELPSDAVVMMRRDWEFLFNHLRSARWVAHYLSRIVGEPHTLGTEPVRYHELALEDLAAPEREVPQWATNAAVLMPMPSAPLEVASAKTTGAHLVLRSIQEDIALTPAPSARELDRIEVLSRLDGIPVAGRTDLGDRLRSYMAEAGTWSRRSLITSTRVYLPTQPGPFESPVVLMVASRLDEMTKMVFRARVELAHHDFMKDTGVGELLSVGVLLSPGRSGVREWDTTMVAVDGDLELDPKYVRHIRAQLDSTLRT